MPDSVVARRPSTSSTVVAGSIDSEHVAVDLEQGVGLLDTGGTMPRGRPR